MAAATDIGDWCLEELGLPGAHNMAAQLGVDAEAAKHAMAVRCINDPTTPPLRFFQGLFSQILARHRRRRCSQRRLMLTCTPSRSLCKYTSNLT